MVDTEALNNEWLSGLRPSATRRLQKKRDWMKYLPILALILSICALTFQVTVLYPWHEELSREFAKLARAIKK